MRGKQVPQLWTHTPFPHLLSLNRNEFQLSILSKQSFGASGATLLVWRPVRPL